MKTNWNNLNDESKNVFRQFYESLKNKDFVKYAMECPKDFSSEDSIECSNMCDTLFPDLLEKPDCPCIKYGKDAFIALEQCILQEEADKRFNEAMRSSVK